MRQRRLLFVEDDATFRTVLSRELAAFGYEVETFANGDGVVECVRDADLDVALLDLKLPGISGTELLRRVLEADRELPVIILTGHGAVPEAVDAMRHGAYDFLTKPVPLDVLEECLRRACAHRELRDENRRLRRLAEQDDVGGILGDSPVTAELQRIVAQIAASDANVLVLGENGTGKELVAKSLHHQSARREHPFVVVNCGAIPENLLESELFGHERGAFTGADRRRVGLFEAAHLGTLFFDEIGELPLAMQPALLRALQFGELRPVGSDRVRRVDVRAVAATNRDLPEEVKAGRFREDLYYRLATLLIEVPPLRHRGTDIELLANVFLERHAARSGRVLRLDADALRALRQHDWPGNVRELESAIVRLATLAANDPIGAGDIERFVFARGMRRNAADLPTLDLEELERLAVVQAMRRHDGDKRAAAAELGVSLKTLYNKLSRFALKDAWREG